ARTVLASTSMATSAAPLIRKARLSRGTTMNLDRLPEEFEQFVSRARIALDQEITRARGIVATANAEKEAAQNALSNLQAELKQVQADLNSARAYLQRGSTLAGLDSEIARAGKELAQLKSETAKEAKALEALAKQRSEAEARNVALNNEA